MNKLEETARWLEAGAPERNFNMNRLLDLNGSADTNWCGTECCIAGYVVTRWADPKRVWDVETTAAQILGLTPKIADALFYPKELVPENTPWLEIEDVRAPWDQITPAQAAQAVRNVMKYNDPKWEEILE